MKFFDEHREWVLYCIGGALVGIAIIIRIIFFPITSWDFTTFTSVWYNYIISHGHILALRDKFSDYNMLYLYFVVIGSYLPIGKLLLIKLISFPFDFVLAFFAYKLVQIKYPKSYIPFLAAVILLFVPTVLMNGSLWGQADAMYACFLLGMLYFLYKKKPLWAMIFVGIAFAIKLQTIFLFPVLFILILTNQLNITYLLAIPAVYLLAGIPAFIVGKPIIDILTVYLTQAGEYKYLQLSAPNIFQWFAKQDYFPQLSNMGILLAGVFVLVITFLVLKHIKKLSIEAIILLSFIFSIAIPFLLPEMHDRYFYLADVLSVIYAFYNPKHFYIPILVQIASLASYTQFLFNMTVIPLYLDAFIYLGMLVFLIVQFYLLYIKGNVAIPGINQANQS